MRIDLHVHSNQSKRPSQWFLRKIGSPESFTKPEAVYSIAKKRGMDWVTITDHNRIRGALEIAHLPNVFVSEEITTYFPEDGCKIHVLAFRINEAQHEDIQKVRKNIYELIDYLNRMQIQHAVAHPLYAINDRLTAEHFEKLLLQQLTPADIDRLSDKYDRPAMMTDPWRKTIIGGSDDHSSLNIARSHTIVSGARTLNDFFKGVADGSCRAAGTDATPQTMAHNLYGIAYQYYHDKFNLDRFGSLDPLFRFLNRMLRTDAPEGAKLMPKLYHLWRYRLRPVQRKRPATNLQDIIRRETQRLLADDPQFKNLPQKASGSGIDLEDPWFAFVNKVCNAVALRFADHLMDHLAGANVFNIFHTIGSAGGLYTLLAPYFIAFSHFTKDNAIVEEVQRRFAAPHKLSHSPDTAPLRVAHFTDTYYEVNGVALTLQKQVQVAHKHKLGLTVITCNPDDPSHQAGVANFDAIGSYQLPEYPEIKIFYPPLLEMLEYCYHQGCTRIVSSTPGPVGLAGLAVSKILKLPISGIYHTQLPQYARLLTGDDAVEELTWKYILWYYDQMDVIRVPSASTKAELVEKGIDPKKIKIFARGIDVDRFHPSRRNGVFQNRYQVPRKSKTLLYVGRVSKEKNLPLLVDSFKHLCDRANGSHLVVVGDGPYKYEMEQALAGLPCTFTGYLDGDDLADVYASADLFVFPSATDTFGNVVLEAQASGIPVLVSDQGGPRENVLRDQTGLILNADDTDQWVTAIESLLSDNSRIEQMGLAARKYMESRSFEAAFIETWRTYRDDGTERGRHTA